MNTQLNDRGLLIGIAAASGRRAQSDAREELLRHVDTIMIASPTGMEGVVIQAQALGGLAPVVYANLNRATRPASLELRSAGLDRNQINRKKQERILHLNGPDQGAGSPLMAN